jgi:hypothetical protein
LVKKIYLLLYAHEGVQGEGLRVSNTPSLKNEQRSFWQRWQVAWKIKWSSSTQQLMVLAFPVYLRLVIGHIQFARGDLQPGHETAV